MARFEEYDDVELNNNLPLATFKNYDIVPDQDMDKVEHSSIDFCKWYNKTILGRVLIKGTNAMKRAGKQFLPQNELESEYNYQLRLSGSTLLNGFNKTCSFLAGQVFQKDLIFEDSIPTEIEEFLSDIDTKGNDINVFSKRFFQNGLGKGVSLILVDSPVIETNENGEPIVKTQAEEEREGIRPFFTEVKPENVLGFRTDERGNLSLVRIAETVKKDAGMYGVVVINRVRVLTPGNWELFEEDENGDYSLFDSGRTSINFIPLIPFIPGKELSLLYGESPLSDLAELNLGHWKSKSDQNYNLHVGRTPLRMSKMMGDIAKIPISTSYTVNSDDENSDMKYVEITGASLEAGQRDLTEIESDMALYGLQQLIPRSGNKTATEKVLTSSESNSSLGSWVGEFETVMQAAFEILALFIKKEFPKNGVSANKEFDYGIADVQELNTLLKAEQQGILSKRLIFDEFKRRGSIGEIADYEEVQAEIEEDTRNNQGTLSSLAGGFFEGAAGETE